jgi:hypothetical protein
VWSDILVIICSFLSIIILFFYAGNRYLHLRLYLSISVLSIIAATGGPIFYEHLANDIVEWSKVAGITFTLIVMALLIREMKPAFARFPVLFSYMPLFIILVYPFIADVQILKDVLNQILQGGALFIVLLFYLTLIRKMDDHILFLLSIILFTAAYLLYWFGGEFPGNHLWTWQLPLISGMILITLKFADIFKNLNLNY